jgi:predicted RNA-binding Zn-ribbon protein involved in translation (DUF1610 family)
MIDREMLDSLAHQVDHARHLTCPECGPVQPLVPVAADLTPPETCELFCPHCDVTFILKVKRPVKHEGVRK